MDKPKLDSFQILMLVIALVGLAISIYAIWRQYGKNTDSVFPSGNECSVNADCGDGMICANGYCIPEPPGTPQIWTFDESQAPSKYIFYNFPEPVHLTTIIGNVDIIKLDSQCKWFKRIGFSVYVRDSAGNDTRILKLHPYGGYGPGTVNFEKSVGLNDIVSVFCIIDRYYYFPGACDILRFDRFYGTAMVIA